MKKQWSYFRAILLSIIAAFIIDAAINFDEYQKGWLVGLHETSEHHYKNNEQQLPIQIGKVSGMIFYMLLK